MSKQVIFINSHPIQYFAPMYKRLNERGVKTACWYCTDTTLRGSYDQEFGQNVKWDVPLLDGYEYQFFANKSWESSPEWGFFGLLNPGMLARLFRIPKSVVVVHGWHYATLLGVLLLGRLRGHTMCLRCEMPLNQEQLKTGWKQRLKLVVLKRLLFPCINYFLCIGQQNRAFYQSLGLPDERLLFAPYSVDNARFRQQAAELAPRREALRQALGIPADAPVVVYSAKYIEKKRPLDLLHAFAKLGAPGAWLLLVGEGELRPDMERFIAEQGLRNVVLTGFVNQSKIAEYYAIGDLFVMCSGPGETWGLSANEAMNFNLPLLISDVSGCAPDLVRPSANGYVFRTGDIADLTRRLRQVLVGRELTHEVTSADLVQAYSYDAVADALAPLTGAAELARPTPVAAPVA